MSGHSRSVIDRRGKNKQGHSQPVMNSTEKNSPGLSLSVIDRHSLGLSAYVAEAYGFTFARLSISIFIDRNFDMKFYCKKKFGLLPTSFFGSPDLSEREPINSLSYVRAFVRPSVPVLQP